MTARSVALTLAFLLLAMFSLSACTGQTTVGPTQDLGATVEVRLASIPTATPYPTLTPWPTPEPYPTGTPYPTATPYPTLTPWPTPEPYPTGTPYPTATPYPTLTPWPTPEPYPTGTPYPTLRPLPTHTPVPTPLLGKGSGWAKKTYTGGKRYLSKNSHTSIDDGNPDLGKILLIDCAEDKNTVEWEVKSWAKWITDGSIDAWYATDGGEREYFTGFKASSSFFASSTSDYARVTKAILAAKERFDMGLGRQHWVWDIRGVKQAGRDWLDCMD